MREHQTAGVTSHTTASAEAQAQAQPGRSTLAQPQEQQHVQPRPPPLFGDDAQWETIYSDDHHDAHAAPYEHHSKRADDSWAKQGAENRGGIHADKTTAHTAGGRPGVVVGGKGIFMLKAKTATRYTYGETDVGVPFDIVDRDKLTSVNFNEPGEKHAAHGKTERLLLNPSQPRVLTIHGTRETCVLSWVDGMSAAWLPLSAIAGDTQAIHAKVDALAKRENPEAIRGKSTRYVVRNDKVGQTTPGDAPGGKDKVLGPHEKGGDNVVHYLDKNERKPGFDAEGKPTGTNVTRSFVALCMNLPEPGVAPVAIDTLLTGSSFFVMTGAEFRQEVAVYGNNKATSHERDTWVFGHVAKAGANGPEPDPARRGWVPLRVLARASELHETTHAP